MKKCIVFLTLIMSFSLTTYAFNDPILKKVKRKGTSSFYTIDFGDHDVLGLKCSGIQQYFCENRSCFANGNSFAKSTSKNVCDKTIADDHARISFYIGNNGYCCLYTKLRKNLISQCRNKKQGGDMYPRCFPQQKRPGGYSLINSITSSERAAWRGFRAKKRSFLALRCNPTLDYFCDKYDCNDKRLTLTKGTTKNACKKKKEKSSVRIVFDTPEEPCCLYGTLNKDRYHCRDKHGWLKQDCFPPKKRFASSGGGGGGGGGNACASNQRLPHWKDVNGRCLPSCGGAKKPFCASNDCKGFQISSGNNCSDTANYNIKQILDSYQQPCCMRKKKEAARVIRR